MIGQNEIGTWTSDLGPWTSNEDFEKKVPALLPRMKEKEPRKAENCEDDSDLGAERLY